MLENICYPIFTPCPIYHALIVTVTEINDVTDSQMMQYIGILDGIAIYIRSGSGSWNNMGQMTTEIFMLIVPMFKWAHTSFVPYIY